MPRIPQVVLEQCPLLEGLTLRHRGKVRDSYDLPGHPEFMLVVASDRCSIFDFVLPILIPGKGEVLTAMSHFWSTEVFKGDFATDLVACGAGIDEFLPKCLRGDSALQVRATVVRVLPAPTVEDIVRGYLTGSGLKAYQKDGFVCGHRLPEGLRDGDQLPTPIYTPTTKAVEGHDEHITAESVDREWGTARGLKAIEMYQIAARYARKQGLIIVDTKFELSQDPVDGRWVVVDEKLTPDSSRYWDEAEWQEARTKGKVPQSMDKQFVREQGKKLGIDKLDPVSSEHLDRVEQMEFSLSVIEKTRDIYMRVFRRLTGYHLGQYQHEHLGIS